jgi:hypothetical protein
MSKTSMAIARGVHAGICATKSPVNILGFSKLAISGCISSSGLAYSFPSLSFLGGKWGRCRRPVPLRYPGAQAPYKERIAKSMTLYLAEARQNG